MGKVIFNSDDFGYSRGVNYGIIDAYQLGILTSTTLMANMPGFEQAIQLKKDFPGLGVGVHLTLTCGESVLENLHTIAVGQQFRNLSFYQEPEFCIDLDELYQEWDAQIQKVYKAGIRPSHLDSHHHVHTFQQNQEVVVALAKKYDLPVRGNFMRRDEVKTVDYFEPLFDEVGTGKGDKLKLVEPLDNYLEKLLEKMRSYQTTEVMCHTAYIDQQLQEGSGFVFSRINQVEFMIHSEFAQRVKNDKEIELVTYNEI